MSRSPARRRPATPRRRTAADDDDEDPRPGAHLARLFASIYAVARKIPRGRIATYGQVAELAGLPGGSRVAGAAMKANQPAQRVPWQRVVGKRGKQGRIAIHDPVGAAVQRQLLEREGVTVSERGMIELDEFGWLPGERRRVARTGRG